MPNMLLNLYKQEGETPLECLKRFQAKNPDYQALPLSYVGRLDPMASGVLLVAAGEENKNREVYLSLPKEYECEILFGVSTDSHDILGLVQEISRRIIDMDEIQSMVEKILPDFTGTYAQKYPPFSSKPVDGKPLFMHARESNLENIAIPSHEVRVSSITVESWKEISTHKLEKNIPERISKVGGDFRQQAVLSHWKEVLADLPAHEFPLLKIRISCESGFYVRTFAEDLGKKIGVPALVFSIVRTKVGEYTLSNSIH